MCFFTILLPRITLNSVKCKNAYSMIFAKQPILLVSETNTNHINLTLNIYCHTRLHLGFSANLRILQVPTCKMEPRSGNIFCKNRPMHRLRNQPDQHIGCATDPTTKSSLRTCFIFQCCAVSPPQLFPS